MEFKSNKQDGFLVVEASGRMDAITAPEFEAQCKTWLADGDTNVLIDFSQLEYISSAGLRSVLSAAKQLKGANGELRFCALSGMVSEVFSVSGFASMFRIFPDKDTALAN